MAQQLNKFLSILFFICTFNLVAQEQNNGVEAADYEDYKDHDQHERFYKRRKLIGAWQINQLRKGALIVRLKTNQMAIKGLIAQGNTQAANKLEAETFAINKNTMFAYLDNFTFCKVYFIPSNFSDSLLNGAKSGIFLDTNLLVSPSIEMAESFYLLAERDYSYNSSIGFIPEAEARSVQEKGNPSKPMAIVLKNKYGHQLKNPFPYQINERTSSGSQVEPIIGANGIGFVFYINRRPPSEIPLDPKRKSKTPNTVTLPKNLTYAKLSEYVSYLNSNLKTYYQKTPPPEPSRIPEDVRPFLY